MDDLTLVIPDPFPSAPPRPIIPVEEEDIDDPNTGAIQALKETDPAGAQRLARQKVRASSRAMEKVAKKHTPLPEPPVSEKKD